MILKKSSFIPLLVLSGFFTAASAMPAMTVKPYIGFSAGGTTQLSQSSHGALTTMPSGSSTFYSNLYGHMQQENTFGPVFNLEGGVYLNDIFRTSLSVSYFQSDEMVRSMATSVTDGTGNGTTTSYFSAKTWLFMANVYANFGSLLPLISPHTQPYVGLGLGVANNELGNQKTYFDGSGIDGVSFSNSSRNFAYKLMAGVNYNLTEHLLFNLQYAFLHAGNYVNGKTGAATNVSFVTTKTYTFPIYANQFTAGLVYKFS